MLYVDRESIPAFKSDYLDMKRTSKVIRDRALSPHQRGELRTYHKILDAVCSMLLRCMNNGSEAISHLDDAVVRE